MGIRVEPPVTGNDCTRWDPPNETPAVIYCLFEGIKKGDDPAAVDAPNGHIFKLDQDPANACQWFTRNTTYGWYARLSLDVGNSWLYLRDTTVGQNYYFWQPNGPGPLVEYHPYPNSFDTEFFDWGWDGYGVIFWQHPFVDLPESLQIDHAEDLMLEMFTDDNTNLYLKYCSLDLRLNITVKIPR